MSNTSTPKHTASYESLYSHCSPSLPFFEDHQLGNLKRKLIDDSQIDLQSVEGHAESITTYSIKNQASSYFNYEDSIQGDISFEEFPENPHTLETGNIPKKNGKWTKEEDEILLGCVSKLGAKKWREVAAFVKGRNPTQCLHRWTKILQPGLKKGPWTPRENQKLINWVKKEGPNKWSKAVSFIDGRSGKQIREHWFNNLCPDVKKGNWSLEEVRRIFDLYQQYGPKWSKIAQEFRGRTENSIKNRFYSTLRKLDTLKRRQERIDSKSSDKSDYSVNAKAKDLLCLLPEAIQSLANMGAEFFEKEINNNDRESTAENNTELLGKRKATQSGNFVVLEELLQKEKKVENCKTLDSIKEHKFTKEVKHSEKSEAKTEVKSKAKEGLAQLDDLFDFPRTPDSRRFTRSAQNSSKAKQGIQSNVELLSMDADTPTASNALPIEESPMEPHQKMQMPQESPDFLNFHSLTPSPVNASPRSSNSMCSAASFSLHACNKCVSKVKTPLSQAQIANKQMVSNVFIETKSGSTTGSMSNDPNRVYQILLDELSLHSNNFRKEELISKLNQIQMLVQTLKCDVYKMDPPTTAESHRSAHSPSHSPQSMLNAQNGLFFINTNTSSGINSLIPHRERLERPESENSKKHPS